VAEGPIRPGGETLLSDNWARLTRHEFDYRRRDGTWQRQVREVYDKGNGAVALLHDPVAATVLLTRQFRLPAFLNGGTEAVIEAPAGLLEGADPLERMREELVEETGYQVTTLEHLSDVYMTPGSVTETLVHFIGTYSADQKVSEGGGKHDEGEDIEVLHLPLDQALAMMATGEIRDAKTIILLQHLALKRAGLV
jgi:nudix-type nucleoside diphosphatase (YffH/AdpP family)